MEQDTVQKEFDRITNRGIILGYVWIMGVGSIISLVSAYQANKLFRDSGFMLKGKDKIGKCLLIGIGGLIVWVISIVIIIIFKKKSN